MGGEAAGALDVRASRSCCAPRWAPGHGGPSGRYDAWRDEAIVLAFVCDAVGRHARDRAGSTRCTPPTASTLEAEWAAPRRRRARTAVLCHPHPQYGGTMRSIVISALFEALPARGLSRACASTSAASRAARASTREGDARAARRRRRDRRAGRAPRPDAAARAGRLVVRRRHGARRRRPAHRGLGRASRRRCASGRAVYDAVARDPRPKLLVLAAARRVPRAGRRSQAETSRRGTRRAIEVVAGRESLLRGPHRRGRERDARRRLARVTAG